MSTPPFREGFAEFNYAVNSKSITETRTALMNFTANCILRMENWMYAFKDIYGSKFLTFPGFKVMTVDTDYVIGRASIVNGLNEEQIVRTALVNIFEVPVAFLSPSGILRLGGTEISRAEILKNICNTKVWPQGLLGRAFLPADAILFSTKEIGKLN